MKALFTVLILGLSSSVFAEYQPYDGRLSSSSQSASESTAAAAAAAASSSKSASVSGVTANVENSVTVNGGDSSNDGRGRRYDGHKRTPDLPSRALAINGCIGSNDIAAVGPGYGLSLGGTKEHKRCEDREDTKLFFNMGMAEAATLSQCSAENATVIEAITKAKCDNGTSQAAWCKSGLGACSWLANQTAGANRATTTVIPVEGGKNNGFF